MEAPHLSILEYNAFTRVPFAGNPAGVVLDASGLDDDAMQRIARQLKLAETAFLVPATRSDADVRLRWFTPAREVDLCGHATIAAFTAAADHGIYAPSGAEPRELRVETRSGVLTIGIQRVEGRAEVSMQIPVPDFHPLEVERDRFAALWGVPLEALAGDWWVHRTLDYWYVPVQSRQALASLRLDVDGLAQLSDRAAFTFFCRDTVDAGSHWHLRFFAPFHGVAEDIVTGSAQGPMGVLYQEIEGEAPQDWSEYIGEQGDVLNSPGRVRVRVRRRDRSVTDVVIVGGAVAMLEGKMRV